MLLYRHSTRCSMAMQWFLDCNPHFWQFVPMVNERARAENELDRLHPALAATSVATPVPVVHLRSNTEASAYLADMPPLPSSSYVFSNGQCARQVQTFKDRRNTLPFCKDLDLYNATIIAVCQYLCPIDLLVDCLCLVPDNCSGPLQRLVEALLITHAETKLNTMGHLDGSGISHDFNLHGMTRAKIIADRGDWCAKLIRRSSVAS